MSTTSDGLCNSPDIFQEKMSSRMEGLDFVRTYIDDLLVLTKGTWQDHLEKLDAVLKRILNAGLKVTRENRFLENPSSNISGTGYLEKGSNQSQRR